MNFLVPVYYPQEGFIDDLYQFILKNDDHQFLVLFDHSDESRFNIYRKLEFLHNCTSIFAIERLGLVRAHLFLLELSVNSWVTFIHQDDELMNCRVFLNDNNLRTNFVYLQKRKIFGSGGEEMPTKDFFGLEKMIDAKVQDIVDRNYIGSPSTVVFYNNPCLTRQWNYDIPPLFFDVQLYCFIFLQGCVLMKLDVFWSNSVHGVKGQASSEIIRFRNIFLNGLGYLRLARQFGCHPTFSGFMQVVPSFGLRRYFKVWRYAFGSLSIK